MRLVAVALAGLLALDPAPRSEPPRSTLVGVRYREGAVHGFLELRTAQDSLIAQGDLLQIPKDSTVEIRLVLRFLDQSLLEETTTFTQHQTFRLKTYHLVEQGPAFAADLDATLAATGHFQVETRSHKDAEVKRYQGTLELPADVANGLPVTLAKNLRAGDTATVHLVAFTPKPRLIGLRIAYAGAEKVAVGSHRETVARFTLSPRLGAVTGFLAKLLGKLPPDSHVWIVTDVVPAFVRFEGPMFTGPVWRLSLATPRWPRPPVTAAP